MFGVFDSKRRDIWGMVGKEGGWVNWLLHAVWMWEWGKGQSQVWLPIFLDQVASLDGGAINMVERTGRAIICRWWGICEGWLGLGN